MSNSNNQTKDIYNIPDVEDLSSETAANIQGGAALTIYEDINLQGKVLGRFDRGGRRKVSREGQKMSSVRINSGVWAFYDGTNFRGKSVRLRRGIHNFTDHGLNDQVDSFRRVG